jgi:hypothetical protein
MRFLYCLNDEATTFLNKIHKDRNTTQYLCTSSNALVPTASGMFLLFMSLCSSWILNNKVLAAKFSNDAPDEPLLAVGLNKWLRYKRKVT